MIRSGLGVVEHTKTVRKVPSLVGPVCNVNVIIMNGYALMILCHFVLLRCSSSHKLDIRDVLSKTLLGARLVVRCTFPVEIVDRSQVANCLMEKGFCVMKLCQSQPEVERAVSSVKKLAESGSTLERHPETRANGGKKRRAGTVRNLARGRARRRTGSVASRTIGSHFAHCFSVRNRGGSLKK